MNPWLSRQQAAAMRVWPCTRDQLRQPGIVGRSKSLLTLNTRLLTGATIAVAGAMADTPQDSQPFDRGFEMNSNHGCVSDLNLTNEQRNKVARSRSV